MAAKLKIVAVCVCMAIVLFFSLYKLTESPPVWYDEGIYSQLAINSALFSSNDIQIAPGEFVSGAFVTGGYPFIQPVALSFRLFGIGIFQSRIVMAGFIVLLVTLLFVLTKKMFGSRYAILAAFLCALFPVLYGNGKNMLGEVPGLVYLFCFLWATYELERKKYQGTIQYIFAGLSAGLCVSTKPLFLVLGGAVLIAVILHRRSVVWNMKGLLNGLVAFLIPLVIWFSFQFEQGDSMVAIANYYANPYGIADVGQQIVTNFVRFFTESSPVYLLVLSLIWIGSFVIRVSKKVPVSLTEKIALIFTVLVLAAYLRTAGWYRYFFVAQIVTIAFVPHAVSVWITMFVQKYKSWRGRDTSISNVSSFRITLGCCTLLFLIQGYQLLFTSWVATHYSSTKSAELTEFFSTVPPDTTYFLYDVPEIVEFLPHQSYYQYLAPTRALVFGVSQVKKLDAGIPDVVISSGIKWPEVLALTDKYEQIGVIGGFAIARRHNKP